MWSFETTKPQKLTLEEAFKSLNSFISECEKVWERERLDWAPALLDMLRDFRQEAVSVKPERGRVNFLFGQVWFYFVANPSLKEIGWVLWDVVTIYCTDEK